MLTCGIDIGTTNLKVGLSDPSGRLLHVEMVPTPRSEDRFGVVTDPADLLQRVEEMLIEAWRQAGGGRPIAAISTTGVGEDGVLLDAAMRPMDSVIPWFDRRASRDAQAICASGAHTERSGLSMDAARTGAKWHWLSRHRGALVARAQLWVALTDFPLIAWGAGAFISETLAARTGCYDPFKREWIEELLRICSAPKLPDIRPAGSPVGYMNCPRLIAAGAVTAETLLVAGGHDHPIAASAIRRFDAEALVDSLGTANVLYAEAPGPGCAARDRDPLVAWSVPVGGGEGIACIGVFEFAEALRAAGSRQRVREYLSVMPLSGQPGTPCPMDDDDSTPRDIREVLEVAGMMARAMLDGFVAGGITPGPIYATGGWSRSRGLLQLRASILGQAILAAEEPELTVVGAALMAAEAAGGRIDFRPELVSVEPLEGWQQAYARSYSGFVERLRASRVV